jgi:hypothetical protein
MLVSAFLQKENGYSTNLNTQSTKNKKPVEFQKTALYDKGARSFLDRIFLILKEET